MTSTSNNTNNMATKTIIKPAKSPTAVGPYNHAVRVGDLLFCAGQIPISPADGNLITGDIKAQTERVLENVKAILDDMNAAARRAEAAAVEARAIEQKISG